MHQGTSLLLKMGPSSARGFSERVLLRVLNEFPLPGVYWLAYSGGLDSSVLLHALANIRDQLPAPLRVLHLDHGLQPDSPGWTGHCQNQCARLGLPFTHRRLQLEPRSGESLEACAREARLGVFREMLEAGDLLLTAQHREDQAETLLLQLLRGSGLDGLSAMPRLAPLGAGQQARPLLDFTRSQLQGYAREHGISWIEDPSNAQVHFDRNYLRHRILPLLEERWPSYATTLARSAGHCAEARSLLDTLEQPRLEAVRGNRVGTLNANQLASLDPALCRELLRRWIRERGFRPPDRLRLERIRTEVLAANSDRNPLVEWPGAQLRRYRDELFLLSPLPPLPVERVLDWPRNEPIELPDGLGALVLEPSGTWDELRRAGALSVGFGVNALRCRPAENRPHRPLKHLYQERGVPNWLRPYVPLLFVGGQLHAVGEFWTCIHPETSVNGPWRLSWTGHTFSGIF